LIVALALLGAAVYEAAIALEWIQMGEEPGEEAAGQAVVTLLAFGALLVGFVVSAFAAIGSGSRRLAFLVPLAAAAYLFAHYYAFDPYYLPTLRRFTESGVSATWIYGVATAGVVVAALIGFRIRAGLALTPLLLLVCAASVLGLGIGH
jgi:hypothetical protein